jgi:hypothetical protein
MDFVGRLSGTTPVDVGDVFGNGTIGNGTIISPIDAGVVDEGSYILVSVISGETAGKALLVSAVTLDVLLFHVHPVTTCLFMLKSEYDTRTPHRPCSFMS